MVEKDRWALGRIGGIAVAMHWTVLVTALWLLFWLRDLVATLVAVPVLLLLFLAHEFGHVALARRQRVKVYDIVLYGLHGRTGHATANHRDEIAIAWGGVAAQMLLLAAALLFGAVVVPLLPAWAMRLASPALFVLVEVNIFLAVLALLPIGPFDGHKAWGAIGLARAAWRRRGQPKPLTDAQQRELHRQSKAEVVDLLDRLKKKEGRDATDRDA
jgi:Zn-dependent protease